jgi:hypothetical protein
MTVTLAIQFCERDLPFLRLHLPVYLSAFSQNDKVNAFAASDQTGGPAAEYLTQIGVTVVNLPFFDDWGQFWNSFLSKLREHGIVKVLRADPDEAFFPSDLLVLDSLLDQYALIALPRLNFWGDRKHEMNNRPDAQWRGFRVDRPVYFAGKRHEGVGYHGAASEILVAQDAPMIYHYGPASQTGIYERALRYWNYDRMDKGLDPVEVLPPEVSLEWGAIPYDGPQPLDPEIVGLYAPFER